MDDRLSELPLSLILHILSFLPMRDVVCTTLLSKRWENLWTILPCLNFSAIISEYDEPDNHRFRNFVNRALLSWKGTRLLKFTIDYRRSSDKSLVSDMNLWVRLAVENKVEELNICLMYKPVVVERDEAAMSTKEDVYRAPQCLYSCSSIRKLSLVGFNLRIHGPPAWYQLKSLRIHGFYLSEHLINQILSGTPQLEEFDLCLVERNENLNICSTSLKTLKIEKYVYFKDVQQSLDTVLRINCPNLGTLEISGGFYSKCLFTNLSSLTDANLEFNDMRYYDARGVKLLEESMWHIFPTFQHVESVTLSYCSFQVLKVSLRKHLFPPLPNVTFLKLEVHCIELIEMVHLLETFPNLKVLVIEDCSIQKSPAISAEDFLVFETNLPKSFLHQLKIIEITSNFQDSSLLRFIEFLLKHGSMLEKLVLRAMFIGICPQSQLLEVAETMLSMPRSSPTAKVIFNEK